MPALRYGTRRGLLRAAAATVTTLFASGAEAQKPDRPARAISIIVPFPPGGATDLVARILAQGLSPRLGQQVLVENRPGATGAVGSAHVARARPDGYTLVMGGVNTHATRRCTGTCPTPRCATLPPSPLRPTSRSPSSPTPPSRWRC